MFGIEGDTDRPTRRKKLVGYLKAANDVRQSCQQYYSDKYGSGLGKNINPSPKRNYPELQDSVASEEKLLLFPSYAKRHLNASQNLEPENHNSVRYNCTDTESKDEISRNVKNSVFEEFNTEKNQPMVEVDVRGCLYSPLKGPMTRKHRLLIGIARQLCGIPNSRAQDDEQESESGLPETSSISSGNNQDKDHKFHETKHLRQNEEENMKKANDEFFNTKYYANNYRTYNSNTSQLQFKIANSNLMERLGPFMANVLEFRPLTICFYNETTSALRKIKTDEMGHFVIREALNFIPTHVRVQSSENYYVTEKTKLIEPKGISLISDIDDTVKNTSIDLGAREVFRNTFIRDLQDLTIDGVKEWYNLMSDMGVEIHYVSNSPWQLFPTLLHFFKGAELPFGSYHLKSYTGMLQGILEPASERKKPTIMKILSDFPDRSFILVGDSSEADLEVYCDIVLANPGRIMMVLIRDTTHDFFNPAINASNNIFYEEEHSKPRPIVQEPSKSDLTSNTVEKNKKNSSTSTSSISIDSRPIIDKLIDFDDQETTNHDQSTQRVINQSIPRPILARDNFASRKRVPPPRPPKPMALRADCLNLTIQNSNSASNIPITESPRSITIKDQSNQNSVKKDISKIQSISNFNVITDTKLKGEYNSPVTSNSHELAQNFKNSYLYKPQISMVSPKKAKDENLIMKTITNQTLWGSSKKGLEEILYSESIPVNKKLEIWRRRWKKADRILSLQGVKLRSWRVGGDIYMETIQNIEKKLSELKPADTKPHSTRT
ncbi:putative actin cytoskeleton organization protein app1 [Erysiphe necator]|uniref:Putative actin cytoskeleton organization protein app1 n=1 Tax=Uncinula necator TaxID=52586 RepID=A0A0B1P849_UNCNE|nr:putative actin cytoskeleton organization protein app1 [Erysiphe necator]